MLVEVRISARARQDIAEVLGWTLRTFGKAKRAEYRKLIGLAVREVARNPQAARARPDLSEHIRMFHIARPGMRARHFLLVRQVDDGTWEVVRFLYDGMDFASRLPRDEP